MAKQQIDDGMTERMNAVVAVKHRPFTSEERRALMATISQHGGGDHGFSLAAKATGRFMYECREEYRRAIGVNPTASITTMQEGRGRLTVFRKGIDE